MLVVMEQPQRNSFVDTMAPISRFVIARTSVCNFIMIIPDAGLTKTKAMLVSPASKEISASKVTTIIPFCPYSMHLTPSLKSQPRYAASSLVRIRFSSVSIC
jgi:hypothetical protein